MLSWLLPLFVFDEEIVLSFRVDVQHFAHTYLQLISGKKMGASHPLDVSYTSLLGRALTHWKVQADYLLFNNLLVKMDSSATVVQPKNQKVAISAFDRQTSMQVCEAGED